GSNRNSSVTVAEENLGKPHTVGEARLRRTSSEPAQRSPVVQDEAQTRSLEDQSQPALAPQTHPPVEEMRTPSLRISVAREPAATPESWIRRSTLPLPASPRTPQVACIRATGVGSSPRLSTYETLGPLGRRPVNSWSPSRNEVDVIVSKKYQHLYTKHFFTSTSVCDTLYLDPLIRQQNRVRARIEYILDSLWHAEQERERRLMMKASGVKRRLRFTWHRSFAFGSLLYLLSCGRYCPPPLELL
ncbi:hypothetical protein CYMTET_35744, partial [Cymbomonas tetramitiformis]